MFTLKFKITRFSFQIGAINGPIKKYTRTNTQSPSIIDSRENKQKRIVKVSIKQHEVKKAAGEERKRRVKKGGSSPIHYINTQRRAAENVETNIWFVWLARERAVDIYIYKVSTKSANLRRNFSYITSSSLSRRAQRALDILLQLSRLNCRTAILISWHL